MTSIKQKKALNVDVEGIIFSYEKVFTYGETRVYDKEAILNLELKQQQFIKIAQGIRRMQQAATTQAEVQSLDSMLEDLKQKYIEDYHKLKQKIQKVYQDTKTPEMKLGSPPKNDIEKFVEISDEIRSEQLYQKNLDIDVQHAIAINT